MHSWNMSIKGLSVYRIQTSNISKATSLISVSQNGMKSLYKQRQHLIIDATIYFFQLFIACFFLCFFLGIGNKNIINTNFRDHHFLYYF